MISPPLLEVRGLVKHFATVDAASGEPVLLRAVDGVDFVVSGGEVLGIVGESGCGKSTLAKTLLGIHPVDSGEILLEGAPVHGLDRAGLRAVRRRIQYVYQDPGASLDPRWTIGRSLEEALVIHTDLARPARRDLVGQTLASVGLREEHLDLYPHELSGGQQRRVGLARVLALRPQIVILDEPTSGLDVSVQATILKLLQSLWREFALTYLLISHDLAVVRAVCTRVAVMYLGRIVEIGDTETLFERPRHPYTRSLLAAVPVPGGRKVIDAAWLEGEPPDPADLPSGCRFRPRCPRADSSCAADEPVLPAPVGGTSAACHHPLDLPAAS